MSYRVRTMQEVTCDGCDFTCTEHDHPRLAGICGLVHQASHDGPEHAGHIALLSQQLIEEYRPNATVGAWTRVPNAGG